ncbi:LysR family transcriptional regulator [Pseudoalteromonas sp. CO348]|uniref:LysR family transcriptional regulator n=1 Tax=unclassified Pseudoalteromonas TaxID=194690 RepID=UPI00102340C0|nr:MULTISPECIES: LysR family transcriptional regulator [unclassified Pseudoalteromonas]MCG7539647.1 LysR family transcriptional regulator [Pseudoalteromonas sp. OF7H-1]RZG05747.1 LysR family transcriptional regulator [Pseudoalteromonas sp. CO348]
MYSIAELETFLAIIKHQGVVNAAKQLRLSPATVSHRLNKLEQHLGTTLLFRDSRTLTLSPAGSTFRERVEHILEALYDAEHEIGARGSAVSGLLRVTMPPWVFSQFVMPNLSQFEQAHPQLALDFLINDQFVNIVEGAQDVAIRVGQLADSGLLARKLCDNHRILCAAPSYIDRYGMPDNISELQNHFFVCLPWQREFKLKEPNGRIVHFNAKTRFTISNSDNMTSAALAGHGIAVKSHIAIRDNLKRGELVPIIPGCLESDDAPIWFVRPQHSLKTRKAEAFYEFMKALFENKG